MLVRRIFAWFLTVALLFTSSCGGNPSGGAPSSNASQKLNVAATIFVLADWLKNVGGDHVDVYCLVSGANNPHHFDPTTQDAVQLSRSRAVFAIGLELDSWAAKLARSAGSQVELIEAGRWITPRTFTFGACCAAGDHDGHGHDHEHAHSHDHKHEPGGADPHFWHDPQRVITIVEKLAVELSRLDPAHAADYKTNADKYITRLKELDAEVVKAATLIPKNTRLVTFHDAYSYLFERLNITLAGVFQMTPGIEPSLRDVTEAVRMMKEVGQKTVFKEPLESATAADRVAQEVGARVELLDPMDSEAGAEFGGYIERFRGNLKRLTQALAPHDGAPQ